jgi:general secretion pathway protein D
MFKRLTSGSSTFGGGGTRTTDGDGPVDLTTTPLPGASSLASGLTYFLTFQNMKLDAAVRALSTSSRFKVLSTPVIQTLHNQEAHIIVGESRPVITSSVSDVAGSSSTAVRSNVEYKDIAIELTVTPRINPDGFVTMDIEQKINDVGEEVQIDQNQVPIVLKREAKSAVSVRDQSTIVLGGLIRDGKKHTTTTVPFIGSIPAVGALFRSKKIEKTRAELIVFIRPTVLRNDTEAVLAAQARLRKLKSGKELELEQVIENWPRFGEEPTNAPPATVPAAPSSRGPDGPTESERRAAKVKALQEPVAPPAP